MILFKNWKISTNGKLLAMQHDNLSRELKVVGNIPEGWDWDVLVQVGEYLDIIPIEKQADGGLSVLLKAEQLALSGYYTVQLRGKQGELVRHTNKAQAYVGDSLSGDEHWPEIPSSFTETERSIKEAAKEVEEFALIAKGAADSVYDAGKNAEQLLDYTRTFAETSRAYAEGGTAYEYDETGAPTTQIYVEGAKAYMEQAKEYAEAAAGGGGGSGFPYKLGLGLKVIEDRTLVVDSAENFDGDNDRPASAALVKTQLGNIEAFLATI